MKKYIIMLVLFSLILPFVNGLRADSNDKIHFSCNNATSGALLGTSATITIVYNSAHTSMLTSKTAVNYGTGKFYFSPNMTARDMYYMDIDCPSGTVDYTIPFDLNDASATLSNASTIIGYIDTEVADILTDSNAQDAASEWTTLLGGKKGFELTTGSINTTTVGTGAIDADAIAADAITSSELATSAATEIASAVNASKITLTVATEGQIDDIQERLRNESDFKADVSSLATFAQLNSEINAVNASLRGFIPVQITSLNASLRSYLPTLNEIDTRLNTSHSTGNWSAIGGGSALTAGAVADAVWDELITGHTTGGTFGYNVSKISTPSGSSLTAADIWTYATRTLTSLNFLVNLTTATEGQIDDIQTRLQNESDFKADVSSLALQTTLSDVQNRLRNESDFKADVSALALESSLNGICYDTNLTQGIVVLTTSTENSIDQIESYTGTIVVDTTAMDSQYEWEYLMGRGITNITRNITRDHGTGLYNASSGSGATAAQVWSFGNRQLTGLDEDNTTIDLSATSVSATSTLSAQDKSDIANVTAGWAMSKVTNSSTWAYYTKEIWQQP